MLAAVTKVMAPEVAGAVTVTVPPDFTVPVMRALFGAAFELLTATFPEAVTLPKITQDCETLTLPFATMRFPVTVVVPSQLKFPPET